MVELEGFGKQSRHIGTNPVSVSALAIMRSLSALKDGNVVRIGRRGRLQPYLVRKCAGTRPEGTNFD